MMQDAIVLCLKMILNNYCLDYGTVSFLCNLARTAIACIATVTELHRFTGGLFSFLDSSPGCM